MSTEGYYVSYLSFVLKAQGKSTYKQFFYDYDDFFLRFLSSLTILKRFPKVNFTFIVSKEGGGGVGTNIQQH